MRGSPLAVHPFRGYVLFEKSLFDIAIPQEINYASLYNGFSTDTDRNLNNAVTVKAVSDCYNQDGNPRTGWSYPTPSGTTMK
jgi:hypothetical protein